MKLDLGKTNLNTHSVYLFIILSMNSGKHNLVPGYKHKRAHEICIILLLSNAVEWSVYVCVHSCPYRQSNLKNIYAGPLP